MAEGASKNGQPSGYITVGRLRQLLAHFEENAVVMVRGDGPALVVHEETGEFDARPTPVFISAQRLR